MSKTILALSLYFLFVFSPTQANDEIIVYFSEGVISDDTTGATYKSGSFAVTSSEVYDFFIANDLVLTRAVFPERRELGETFVNIMGDTVKLANYNNIYVAEYGGFDLHQTIQNTSAKRHLTG